MSLFWFYVAALAVGLGVVAMSVLGVHDGADGMDGGIDGADGAVGFGDFGTLFVLASQFLLGFGVGGLIGGATGNETWSLVLAVFMGFVCALLLRKLTRAISGFCRRHEHETRRAEVGDRAVAMLALAPGRTGKVLVAGDGENPGMEYFATTEDEIPEDGECVVTSVDGATVMVRKVA